VVSFMSQLLYPQGKSPGTHWTGGWGGGGQSQSGHSGREKNSQPLPGMNSKIPC